MPPIPSRPIATVVLPAKPKDCPTLSAGDLTPEVFAQWKRACERYLKHSDKEADEVVSFVADAMYEPRLAAWYSAQQGRIDKMTLKEYLVELATFALPQNWQNKLRN